MARRVRRSYTKRSNYWNTINKDEKRIRAAYARNKELIDSTHPSASPFGAYDTFKAAVLNDVKRNDGKSMTDAIKSTLNSRLYKKDKTLGEAKWHHEAFVSDLSAGEKSALYREKVSLKFEKMSYIEDKEKKNIVVKNIKTGDNITFTRREHYKSEGKDIEVYFTQGYKLKLIFVNGSLVTGKSMYAI